MEKENLTYRKPKPKKFSPQAGDYKILVQHFIPYLNIPTYNSRL